VIIDPNISLGMASTAVRFQLPIRPRSRDRAWHRCVLAVVISFITAMAIAPADLAAQQTASAPDAAQAPSAGQVKADPKAGSGLPLPRYVSLKSDRVNVRKGPGFEYPIAWVYQRAGLPVEIIQEYETWRQVRDSEGTEGWVLQGLLSSRRTGVVLPWEVKPIKKSAGTAVQSRPAAALRAEASADGKVLALAEAGTIASVVSCDAAWCQIVIGDQRGYIEQAKLWGVYRNERL
jgi:SH3-like domain-containing protein